ncbi:hypothetical protein B0T12DRAFT_394485 [Alternaria alternata]|nr:hypothetical protein B0T12DRAFT_394485 [Alternaria alternata]
MTLDSRCCLNGASVRWYLEAMFRRDMFHSNFGGENDSILAGVPCPITMLLGEVRFPINPSVAASQPIVTKTDNALHASARFYSKYQSTIRGYSIPATIFLYSHILPLPRGHCIADGLATSTPSKPTSDEYVPSLTMGYQEEPTNHSTATPVCRCLIDPRGG